MMLRASSPSLIDLPYPRPVTPSNSESDISNNGHRLLHRSSESSIQPRGSSSESVSSDQSAKYMLRSKYHLPLRKTKSSGSSDGYNEDEELMMENDERNSSPGNERNEDSQLTFV